ncbi:MAG: hypothetical protein ACYDHY_19720 [Acidiferrobacterales bacterium]
MSKPKVICQMICHYGKKYMDAAIQSVEPFVDKIIVLYSEKPSQGHPTDLVCPDTREELKAISDLHPKCEWVECANAGSEGDHRGLMLQFLNGYDVQVICDTDEVFDPIDLPRCIEEVYKGDKTHYNVSGFMHFWKNHKWYCDDGFQPNRFVNLNNTGHSEQTINCKIYHFSYCQPVDIIKYKLQISGHHDEFRSDWLEIYEKWTPENQLHKLHPVSLQVWEEAKPYNLKLPYGL